MSTAPRVLVVDDNAINLALMTYLLDAYGFETAAAGNGEEALACLADWPDAAAVLCDIQMPVMDGYEFARRFRAHPSWACIPLVAVTALAMVGDRERILAAGFDAYLAKPIEPQTFLVSLFDAVPSLRAASAGDGTPGTGKDARP
jgi:CheY-like chemotaxis protein